MRSKANILAPPADSKAELIIGHDNFNAVRLLIENETSMNDADRTATLATLDVAVPAAIDTLVGVATGEINLQKKAAQCGKFWKACCPCCFK